MLKSIEYPNQVKDGYTLLISVTIHGDYFMIEELLKRGANPPTFYLTLGLVIILY